MRRCVLTWAALSAVVLLVPTGSGPAGAGTSVEGAPALGVASARGAGSCTATVLLADVVMQGQALRPRCSDRQWVFTLPARSDPAATRRTEAVWAREGRTVRARRGDVVTYCARITGDLGPAARSDEQWHVLWQLQGPTRGRWRPPPVSLEVRDGRLWLSGGHGHPRHSWATRNFMWRYPLAAYRDDTSYLVSVRVRLSPVPSEGLLTARVDGEDVLVDQVPRSESGLTPGTLYPGQDAVESRSGLYRGAQGAPPPTYRQQVQAEVLPASECSA